jgi:hypothetical protein
MITKLKEWVPAIAFYCAGYIAPAMVVILLSR